MVRNLFRVPTPNFKIRSATHLCALPDTRATGLTALVHAALHRDAVATAQSDSAWVQGAAGRILAAMEAHRSTWQIWHVRAEAQRQVRPLQLQADQSELLVDLLIGDVLENRSVSLAAGSAA